MVSNVVGRLVLSRGLVVAAKYVKNLITQLWKLANSLNVRKHFILINNKCFVIGKIVKKINLKFLAYQW